MPYKNREDERRYQREYKAKKRAEGITGYDRSVWLKRNYGITVEEFDAMLLSQNGRCACCFSDSPGQWGTFHVDHCHDSGAIRGLLCQSCSTGIGKLGDSIEGLERALTYLKKST
jgi:hypothetical protein